MVDRLVKENYNDLIDSDYTDPLPKEVEMHIEHVRKPETLLQCPECQKDISGHPDYNYCPYCKAGLTTIQIVGKLTSADQDNVARILRVIDSEIHDRIGRCLPVGSVIDLNTYLVDLGVDSLEAVEIIMVIEEEFDVTIPDDDAESFPSFLHGDKTIKDFVETILAYLSSLSPATT